MYLTRDIQERDVMVDPAVRDYVGTSLIPQKMSQINQAITNKKDISFVYIKMNGHVSYRTITPTDIQEMSSHGHTFMAVTGYCQQQEEERFFHLGRVFEVRESV